MSKGYVYVLSNPSMPGLVKIGRSISGGFARAKSFYQTGVPDSFVLEFEIFCDWHEWLETETHKALRSDRYSDKREFFKVTVAEATDTILKLYLEGISGSDSKVVDALCADVHVDLLNLAYQLDLPPLDVFEAVGYLSEFSVRQAIATYREVLARRKAAAEAN